MFKQILLRTAAAAILSGLSFVSQAKDAEAPTLTFADPAPLLNGRAIKAEAPDVFEPGKRIWWSFGLAGAAPASSTCRACP